MTNEVVKKERNITDLVLQRFNETQSAGGIDVPKDYSAENALKSAWFILQGVEAKSGDRKVPALEHCSKDSIANSLFKMVVDGLNPMKKQCYFIAYGKELTCQTSYQGNIALAKRFSGVKSVIAREIYKDDKFTTEILSDNREVLVKHEQPFENTDKEIIGGYCVVIDSEGKEHLTKMTMKKIRSSWSMGVVKGNGKPHNEFSDEMVKRTLINRACKPWINSSNDESIIDESENDNSEGNQTISIQAEEFDQKTLELGPEPKTVEEPETENAKENDGPGY